jgi:hypothetical protein
MNMKRKVYTLSVGLIAACIAASTASAQTYMTFQYGASAGAVSQVSVANLAPVPNKRPSPQYPPRPFQQDLTASLPLAPKPAI